MAASVRSPVRTLLCALNDVRSRLEPELARSGDVHLLAAVESGGEALAFHRGGGVDLCIVDGEIDGCDGVRLGRVLHRERPVSTVLLVGAGRCDAARGALEAVGATRVHAVSRSLADVRRLRACWDAPEVAPEVPTPPVRSTSDISEGVRALAERGHRAIVLVGSAGTPHMMPRLVASEVLGELPMLVAVHHNPRWSAAFARWVGRLTHRDPHVFRPDLIGGRWQPRLQVARAVPGNALSPDLTFLLERVARAGRVLVCVASGMGGLSAPQLAAIRRSGGSVVALDPTCCSQPGFVENAIEAGVVDVVVTVDQCAWLIANAVAETETEISTCLADA